MKEFTHEAEAAYEAYVESVRLNREGRNLVFDTRAAGVAQMRWIEAWNKGQMLEPLSLEDARQPSVLSAKAKADRDFVASKRRELRKARVEASVNLKEALHAQTQLWEREPRQAAAAAAAWGPCSMLQSSASEPFLPVGCQRSDFFLRG